jgi:hypothetical protein
VRWPKAIDIGETAAVTDRPRSPLNLNVLLGAVEAAPPVAAAEVVGNALSEALGARDVSFLIADYSGRSLIRLSHLPQELSLRADDRLVFLTDGMLERNAAAVDALSILTATRHLHPREAVQDLTVALSRRAAETFATTRPSSASTGTADLRGSATPARVPTAR